MPIHNSFRGSTSSTSLDQYPGSSTSIRQQWESSDVQTIVTSNSSDAGRETIDGNSQLEASELKRFGKSDQFYGWSKIDCTNFLSWWRDTAWVKSHTIESNKDVSLLWDSTYRTSDLWSSFYQVAEIATGKPKLICKRCSSSLDHPGINNSGTNSMKNHLKTEKCLRTRNNRGLKQMQIDGVGSSSSMTSIKYKTPGKANVDIMEQLLRVITALQLPFRSVEDVQFQKLVNMLNDEFQLPSATNLRVKLLQRSREIHSQLLEGLCPTTKVSLALDCWSSPTRLAYMAIAAYFIDKDWNYQEALIGFEHIEGPHTGIELAAVLMKVIHQHKLDGRILCITTDNASNNNTLVRGLGNMLQDPANIDLAQDGHLPCLAHVIQLALSELLGKIHIKPTNEELQKVWTDSDANELKDMSGVPRTLAKIRKLSVCINASCQRRSAFRNIQMRLNPELAPKILIQDVKTRWDSTCHMLIRAHKLQNAIGSWLSQNDQFIYLTIISEEWKQVEYLIELTKPFAFFTALISKSKGPTIHNVFNIYESLFNHLEDSTALLKRKRKPWKKNMLEALEASRSKLRTYYSKTYGSSGNLYSIAAILAPEHKLSLFESATWVDDEVNWKDTYLEAFEERFADFYSDIGISGSQTQSMQCSAGLDDISLFIESRKRRKILVRDDESEIGRYLAEPTTRAGNVLEYWKSRQYEYPGLAAMARDILAIPAAGVGVERMFNAARDICHYRQGQLRPDMVKASMLLKIYDKIKLQDELSGLAVGIDDELTTDEREEEIRRRAEELQQEGRTKYISDNEDDSIGTNIRAGTRRGLGSSNTKAIKSQSSTPATQSDKRRRQSIESQDIHSTQRKQRRLVACNSLSTSDGEDEIYQFPSDSPKRQEDIEEIGDEDEDLSLLPLLAQEPMPTGAETTTSQEWRRKQG